MPRVGPAMNSMMSKSTNEKVTIWNATASKRVPVLDALDMTVPFRDIDAARARLERSKAKSKRILRAFATKVPAGSIRKRIK
jgi:hypothetical protein